MARLDFRQECPRASAPLQCASADLLPRSVGSGRWQGVRVRSRNAPVFLGSGRRQFNGRVSGLYAAHIADEFQRAGRVVFLPVGLIDRVLQALTARLDRSNPDFTSADLNGAARLRQKSAPPAPRLDAPGTHKHPAFDDHDPDADEPMWLPAGAQADDLAVVDGG